MSALQRRSRVRPHVLQLADAARHHRLRLRDRACSLSGRARRSAFSSPDEPRVWLGPRRVRSRLRGPEPAVGYRPADRRRDRRPVRTSRDVRRRVLYAAGLLMMRYATTPMSLDLTAGVLIGFGLSGCSFNLVLSALSASCCRRSGAACVRRRHRGRLVRPIPVRAVRRRADRQFRLADGAARCSPALMLLILPLSLALATRPRRPAKRRRAQTSNRSAGARRSVRPPLLRSAGARLLHLRLPARVRHRASAGLSWSIAALGARSAAGRSRASGSSTSSVRSRRLAAEPPAEALHPLGRSISPARCRSWRSSRCRSRRSRRSFRRVTGLIWLSTVPPTSALVALMFGTRWLAMLYGFAFFSHQVGGFLGVWLGGIVFEKTGS